ncbi:MAG TPA: lipopolysaccharide heptosyltransferase II [Gemmataceae bacterium]|nr:lipopolysaccharide heptosyltransferase II [Gemmataceae bacterium]
MDVAELRERSFHRILLIKPSAVGDVIHTIPILVRLRRRYPQAQLDWLLTPRIAELIRHHPALSNVLLFDRATFARFGRSWTATRGLVRFLWDLWRIHYDLVIDLHGQFRSALLSLVSRAPVRIGFDRPRRPAQGEEPQRLVKEAYLHGWTGAREGAWIAYTHRMPIRTLDIHAVDRYLWLAPLLGLEEGPVDFQIPLPEAAAARTAEMLARHGIRGQPYTVLVPGTTWETKHWHSEGFAAVGRYLVQADCRVVLAGSDTERPRCRAVAAACPEAVDLCGQTSLTELAVLLRGASLCVTNDSGSMHLAVALGRPVVSIFGPTDPVWIGPYNRPGAVVQAEGIACAPCYLRKLSHCRHGHACMDEVTPAMVIERIQRLRLLPAQCA